MVTATALAHVSPRPGVETVGHAEPSRQPVSSFLSCDSSACFLSHSDGVFFLFLVLSFTIFFLSLVLVLFFPLLTPLELLLFLCFPSCPVSSTISTYSCFYFYNALLFNIGFNTVAELLIDS